MKTIITLLLFLSLGACVTTKPKRQAHKPSPQKPTRQVSGESADPIVQVNCDCYDGELYRFGESETMGSNEDLAKQHALDACKIKCVKGHENCHLRNCIYTYIHPPWRFISTESQKKYFTEEDWSQMNIAFPTPKRRSEKSLLEKIFGN